MPRSPPSAYNLGMLSPPSRCRPWLALLLSAGLAGPALADGAHQRDQGRDHGRDHERARQALERGQVLPLRQVLDKIEREQQGQVLKIEFEREEGRYLYEIRLLQADGRLVKLKVDAVDGRVLSIKRKD